MPAQLLIESVYPAFKDSNSLALWFNITEHCAIQFVRNLLVEFTTQYKVWAQQ
jgi:hypothetical protein